MRVVLIPLPRGLVTAISPEDQKKVNQHTWLVQCMYGSFYAVTYVGKKSVYLHRFLLNEPKHKEVDHINRFTLDNRRCNLRLATDFEQQCNRSAVKNSTSRYKGVSWCKQQKRWRAIVVAKRKYYHVGRFDTEREAAKAYDECAKNLHGKFAYLNFSGAPQPKPPVIIRKQKAGNPVFNTPKKPKNNTSGFVGVSFHRISGAWYYQGRAKGWYFSKSGFRTAKDAAIAREKYIVRNGLPNRLNFMKGSTT